MIQAVLTPAQGFEKFCEVTGTTTAALLDLYPILKLLPDFLLPLRAYSKELHKHERELYVGHWLNVKKAIKNGTAKASCAHQPRRRIPSDRCAAMLLCRPG